MLQAFSLQVLPGQQHEFMVGADAGKVLKGSVVGLPPAPKELIADDHTSRVGRTAAAGVLPSNVTALHASPFHPKALLSGHNNGTVALHCTNTATAALVWPELARGGVKAIRWSPSRPCTFFVLDGTCNLHCFDIQQVQQAANCVTSVCPDCRAAVPSSCVLLLHWLCCFACLNISFSEVPPVSIMSLFEKRSEVSSKG